MKNILLVEDEISIAQVLKDGLNKCGYTVMLIKQASQAKTVDISKFDLVVLDYILDTQNGIDLLKHWRSNGASTPVLMLTSKADNSMVTGADDYVSKFLEWDDMCPRITALLNKNSNNQLCQVNAITFDRNNRMFMEHNKIINLTRSEYEILRYFFNNPKRIINKEELINFMYKGQNNPQSNVIERHIKSIRSKLEYNPFITLRSLGYRLRS
jgi:DNA-binding response OmpR family regulator